MEKILLIEDNSELCTLVKPFLNVRGIELDYCPYLKKWSLKITSWPTFRFYKGLSPNPQPHTEQFHTVPDKA
jgi:hypothetical protein